jgi:phosphatidylserine decarboxylase
VSEPVTYFNRHTEKVETEQIYGEKPMRWVYETVLGRLALWALVRRTFFSRWYGWRMRRPGSRARINPFIAKYGLDPREFAEEVGSFRSFDDFFSRRLNPAARPLAEGDEVAVFPADGRHLGFSDASAVKQIYAKGQVFDLPSLLGDTALAEKYRHGAIICSRLCPVDYHRFHFPAAGIPAEAHLLNGWLYSVNPVALRMNAGYLWENKRQRLILKTKEWGDIAILVIGATNVGSTTFTYHAGNHVSKGEEMGYFSFGGSFMVTLFEPGKIQLANDLLRESANGRELYARMGSILGRKVESA